MTEEAKKPGADPTAGDPDEEGGALPLDPELADALRDAVESVEGGKPADPPAAPAEGEEAADPADATPEEALARSQDQLLRLQADFENFRRRSLQERRDLYQYGHENLVKDLLSTVDNLDRAIVHSRESGGGDLESLLQGVELVQQEFLGILDQHSVREVEALGQSFDPAVHEAMAQVEDGSVAPNTVIEVLQKGYRLRDRLLRPSRVIVAKEPEKESGDSGEAAG